MVPQVVGEVYQHICSAEWGAARDGDQILFVVPGRVGVSVLDSTLIFCVVEQVQIRDKRCAGHGDGIVDLVHFLHIAGEFIATINEIALPQSHQKHLVPQGRH